MSHTPFGYRIEKGKAVIEADAAEKIRALYQSYLSGDSLDTAAKKAGIKAYHVEIGKMLKNARYLGDGFYPAIVDSDTFAAAEKERAKRAKRLGRIWAPRQESIASFPTAFRLNEVTQKFDDPFQQAEYIYSLIEVEV